MLLSSPFRRLPKVFAINLTAKVCKVGMVVGCLFEFIFEVVGEAILEGWMALMQLCIPRKGISPKVHNVLKVIVKVFSVILFLSIFFGIFLWLDTDALISRVGKYMVLIPLGISVFQIILGCIVRYIEKKK